MELIKNTISLIKKFYIPIGLTITIVFLLLSFFAPLILTQPAFANDLNFTEKGQIGDVIGGLMSPFIAISASILTFMAFYIQYKANKEVQNQFKIQQFESQFYEMLRLHKENVNEMIIEGYTFHETQKSTKTTSGRKIFVTMNTELKSCYNICKREFNRNKIEDKKDIFDYSYYIFFSGLEDFKKNIKNFSTKYNIDELVLNKVYKKLKKAQKTHENKGLKKFKNINLYFNYKPFSGHQSRLSHYYRHLFQLVKFTTNYNEQLISYQEKRNYLRILRAQLSNHEQALLYYNWFADFGDNWEQKDKKKRIRKEGNYFFTDYRMIHNIPPQLILDDFSLETVFDNSYKNFLYEDNRKNDDTLFEILKIKSLLQ